MTTTDDKLSQLRQQLSESIARLAELEAAAIDAVVGGKRSAIFPPSKPARPNARSDRVADKNDKIT